ncbi:hypothetical protein CCR94_01510 [Rhodoblastus sphagnicola]|uniref:DUF2946 domain-containing protein n=1 Tax=Rhodoblastus sphagnicola TaxID=333368 RepID=A0A2S6NG07_9HYPH|nr:hypothetical protein CCR94_01510 [Rhodoblastus sphagnicola]
METGLRRVFAIIPLFLAALLAQIYAPVGSGLAMGRAQIQGVALAPICAGANGAQDRGAPHAPDACCDLCKFVLSGAAPVAPAALKLSFRSCAPRRIAWTLPVARVLVAARRETAQARAPPSAS